MSNSRPLVLLPIAALSLCVQAQNARSFGTVSGYVYCSDSNVPARLASVTLRPVPTQNPESSKSAPGPAVEARVVHTALDGSFSIPRVSPGAYYVIASMEGYVSPLTLLAASNNDLLKPDDELRKALMKTVPIVAVEGAQTASVNVGLQRGASVSGTVLFDDGSPAPGLEVKLLVRKRDQWVAVETGAPGTAVDNTTTDDRGAYRIRSIPPGEKYLIRVGLRLDSYNMYFTDGGTSMHSGPEFSLNFYTGGALRPSAAKPFALDLGEDRPGEDIVLPVSKLHKLQGAVIAQHDGHVLNQAAVELLFADDKSAVGTAMLPREDARFSFPFVPEGDYILRVSSAADVRFEDVPNPPGSLPPTRSESHTLHSYGSAELPVHVDGDRLELTVPVPDKTTPAQ